MSRRFSFSIYHVSFIFAIVVILRLILIPNPGFEADVAFWKAWGLAAADHGVVWSIANTNNNYPTPFAYVLGAMVKLYSIFADPHNFNEFWSNTNTIFLAVSKAFPILADFGIAAIILYIGKNAKRLGFPIIHNSLFIILALMYLLSPVSIMDGAWWGQVDSLGVALFLLSFLAILKKRPFWAGLVFMAAMMTKLQNMIYGPLLFLFIWQTTGFNGLVQAVAGSTVGFFGLNIEFFLARDMSRVLSSLTQNYDYFPWMSLNAFNPWWIATGARGMQVSDKLTVLGITNAKSLGLLTFASFYLFAVLRQIINTLSHCHTVTQKKNSVYQCSNITMEDEKHKQITLRIFWENLIIVNAAFFLFMTQSHDRYLFPTAVFLLLWAPFFLLRKGSNLASSMVDPSHARVFSIFYLLFTIFYFYNLHTALVFNYPNNGLPFLSSLIQPPLTITASFLLLGLFFLFLFHIIRTRSSLYSFIFSVFVFLFLLLTKNYQLFTNRPVSITLFTPIISKQDYGTLATNMPVGAGSDSKTWRWMSVQYAFYKKGIGTHANSFQEYDINRKFTKFTTDYGIDTEAGPKGTAVFEIYADDKLLFRSDKIGRYDLPRHAEVDVTGVKRLGLVTTDAGDGITDDHTDWLNPQLFP